MHKPPRINREFKDLIPPLTPEEYGQLEQNILSQGCRDPIALWRGKIIDGHNRYEICTKHGIAFETVKLRFPSRDAVKLWILDNQLGRRNLSDAMRIKLAARKLEYMGQATCSQKNIAHEAQLSERTVQRYMQIKAYGDEDLLEKIMTGEYKIGTAHRKIGPGVRHGDVITTTREEMAKIVQSPEERKLVCIRGIMDNMRLIKTFYMFLSENKAYHKGMQMDIPARLGAHYRRLPRLMRVLRKEIAGDAGLPAS